MPLEGHYTMQKRLGSHITIVNGLSQMHEWREAREEDCHMRVWGSNPEASEPFSERCGGRWLAEGGIGKSSGGELGRRCSRMMPASAETSGRLLEKLEGPEVEK